MIPPIFLGTLREHYILLFGAAGLFALAVGFVGAWVGARFGARAALRRGEADRTQSLASQSDVQSLSAELQALLIEVERIAEGQRFVAKVLADRNDRPQLAPVPPRVRRDPSEITPH